MGVAVIGSRRGMIPELLDDGRCGVLADDSVGGLSGALTSLARDEALRRRLGQEARRRAAAFDLRAVAASVRGVYRDVVS